jgi:GNAT superfamily N-acetyltransferase
MDITECRAEDLDVLERFMPSYADGAHHADRYARQEAGDSTCLIPWLDGRPVGHAELRWSGCHAPEVRTALPGCPDINGLFVWPEPLRSQGVGTALVRAAEQRARERGIGVMGLGVGGSQSAGGGPVRAARVPARGGFRRPPGVGVRHERADSCVFLVKDLL